MASRKEGSGAAGSGFGASKGKGKAAATGDSAVKQVQIDGLVSGGAGAAAGGGAGRAAAAAWSRRRGWCRPWGRAAAGGTVFVPGPGSSWRPEEQERFHPPPELPNPRPGSPVVVPGEESDSLPCVSEGRDRVGVNCF